jgi:dTDP-4-amino-4,6-dideoxygalactose transaminase
LRSSWAHFEANDLDEIVDEVRALLAEDRLRHARHVSLLEREFAALVSRRYTVAVNSGTSALEGVLRYLQVAGGSVIVPVNTFIATAAAVHHAGAAVRFVDIDETTLAPTPRDIAEAIDSSTRAVVIVHAAGVISPDIPKIRDVCDSRNVVLVEDAAQAIGATLEGAQLGSFGVAATVSLYPTKVITAGEGGLIVTDSKELADYVISLRDHGRDRAGNHIRWGFNWRMSELNAIVARQQLKRLHDITKARQELANAYARHLASIPEVTPMHFTATSRPSYYKFWVRIPTGVDRGALVERIRVIHGIELPGGIQNVPCHLEPVIHAQTGSFPHAEAFCAHHVCLPLYPKMREADVRAVVDALRCEVRASWTKDPASGHFVG